MNEKSRAHLLNILVVSPWREFCQNLFAKNLFYRKQKFSNFKDFHIFFSIFSFSNFSNQLNDVYLQINLNKFLNPTVVLGHVKSELLH